MNPRVCGLNIKETEIFVGKKKKLINTYKTPIWVTQA